MSVPAVLLRVIYIAADESDQENTAAVAAFAQVMAYCVTESCRRALVLRHFGEALPKGSCTGCDCCEDPESVQAQVRPAHVLFVDVKLSSIPNAWRPHVETQLCPQQTCHLPKTYV